MTDTRALCATLIRTTGDLWFSPDPAAREQAKRICRRCPLLTPCADTARTDPTVRGVWGGMSAGERRTRHTGQTGFDPDNEAADGPLTDRRPCGTHAAFLAHCLRDETCDICQAAHEEQVRVRRLARLEEEHAKGGTEVGTAIHRRLGQVPCEACRAAKARAQAERKAGQRARARGALRAVPAGDRVSDPCSGAEAGAGAAA